MAANINKMDWLDLGTWERILTDLTKLARVTAALAKLKKSKNPRRDLKKLGDEIDELQNSIEKICEVLIKQAKSHREFVESLKALLTVLNSERLFSLVGTNFSNLNKCVKIIIGHETRLKRLEASMETAKGKRLRKHIEAPKPKKLPT